MKKNTEESSMNINKQKEFLMSIGCHGSIEGSVFTYVSKSNVVLRFDFTQILEDKLSFFVNSLYTWKFNLMDNLSFKKFMIRFLKENFLYKIDFKKCWNNAGKANTTKVGKKMDVGKQTSFLKEILSCIYDATGSQYAFYRLLGIDLTGFIENLILSAGSEQIGFEFDEELQSFTIWENAMLADEYMEDDDEFKQNVLKMIEQADCQWEPRLKIDQFKNG